MIQFSQIVSYTMALGVAAAIPGPGMAALMARSASGGALVGYSMLLGLIMGDLAFLTFAVFGLALLADLFGAVFSAVKWAASLYLLVLAWQFWTARGEMPRATPNTPGRDLASACIGGLTITLGNPKTIAFYLALAPLVLDLTTVSIRTWGLVLVPVTVVVLAGVGNVFILGALSMRRILAAPGALHLLYRGAALMMAGAALTMMVRG